MNSIDGWVDQRLAAQGEIEQLSRQVAEGTAKISEAEAQIIALSGEREHATQRCEAMEKSINGEKEAVKTAERQMAAAQARASHLMLQVQSLTSERDAAKNALSERDEEHQRALGERDAAVEREREAKERAERGWEMERGERERERQDAMQQQQQQQQQGPFHGHDAPYITPAADDRDQRDSILHSVIAQRTRGRISADSARGTPGHAMHSQTPGPAVSGVATSSSISRGEETRAASVQHSVIARRTRGRMAERENNFLLRHIPAVGQPPAQPVPAVVPLTHTGFVIGRCGADLELTSGYVSRKHAQLQRIAGGWRVLDTVRFLPATPASPQPCLTPLIQMPPSPHIQILVNIYIYKACMHAPLHSQLLLLPFGPCLPQDPWSITQRTRRPCTPAPSF